jgi:hypothetical protein
MSNAKGPEPVAWLDAFGEPHRHRSDIDADENARPLYLRAEGSATDSPAPEGLTAELLRDLKCQYGMVGTRDVDVAAWNAKLDRAIAALAQPVAAPEPLHGFSREDLEAVAEGLESQPQTVNVGNATGEGDDHLPSTAAVAAKFIRAILATQPGTEK